jgi:adenosylcobinamide-GDP ribazoletransferase
MSKSNAIKTFRDLLSFLTIIPLAKTEDFVETSARNMYVFPILGALIGFLGGLHFLGATLGWEILLGLAGLLVQVPTNFLLHALPPVMTLAFLLVITGFQHFDGLVDLGNALGLKRVEDRREIAHRWIVTYKGALLALVVEFLAVLGLFLLNVNLAFRALILAEVCAKLAMVSIVWRGKAAYQGLGSRFISAAKRKWNVAAYAFALVLGFLLLGFAGLLIVGASALFGLFMEKVANIVFGGVTGDMIGATNEAGRSLALVLSAALWILVSVLFTGAVWL